jgi:hypothetical protein
METSKPTNETNQINQANETNQAEPNTETPEPVVMGNPTWPKMIYTVDGHETTLSEFIYTNVHSEPQLSDEEILIVCKMQVGDKSPIGMVEVERVR